MDEIKARLDQIEKKLDKLDQENRQINVKLEEIEKQQNVLNGDFRSLMNDVLNEVRTARKNTEEINVIGAKLDALTDIVVRNEDDLHFLESSYYRTASDLAVLKRIK